LIGALACASASLLLQPGAQAQGEVDWSDVEGRIQYAYYTNDSRALDGVLTFLKPKVGADGEESGGADDGTRAYFRGLANYRLAQVLSATNRSRFRKAIGSCHDEVDKAVEALPVVKYLDEEPANRLRRAEAYALGTACSLAGGDRIGSRIEEAVKLEPRNPRVRLMEAMASFERAGRKADEKAAAVRKLRETTVMFEQARAQASAPPEWGAAEAYVFLGSALIEQRDVVGAREALERALLIAPDYAHARKLMAQITR
jgi:hypothetical protein